MGAIVILGLALCATVPSMLIARVYLRSQGVAVPFGDTVRTFMARAPWPLKALLIGLNFTVAGVAIWWLASA